MRSVGLAVCLCLASSARAADFYSLTVSRFGDTYSMSADAHLAAPPAAVYAVLTDYAHFTRISSAVLVSRVQQRLENGDALVYTDTRACVFFFCKHITELQRYSKPDPQDIVAEVVPEGSDLKRGRSVWHLQAEAGGTRLRWEMTAVPDFWVPPFIGSALVERGLSTQSRRGVAGIEKLARERAHLPPLDSEHKDAQ